MNANKYGCRAVSPFLCVAFATWLGLYFLEGSRVEILDGIFSKLDAMASICKRPYDAGVGINLRSRKEYSPWVDRQGFRSPLHLCAFSERTIDRLLSLPHNCSREANRIWVDNAWVDFNQLLMEMSELGAHGSDPIQCVVFCADHMVPCPKSKCLVPIHLRRKTSDAQMAIDVFEVGDLDILKSHTNFKTILDAGAGVGISTVFLGTMFPEAQIVSIEPLARRFEALLLNTQHFQNVIAVRGSLWPSPQVLNLGSSSFATTISMEKSLVIGLPKQMPKNLKPLGVTQGIPVTVLLELFNLLNFDLLKMDIDESRQYLLQGGGEDNRSWLALSKLIIASLDEKISNLKENAFQRDLVKNNNWRYMGRSHSYQIFMPQERDT